MLQISAAKCLNWTTVTVVLRGVFLSTLWELVNKFDLAVWRWRDPKCFLSAPLIVSVTHADIHMPFFSLLLLRRPQMGWELYSVFKAGSRLVDYERCVYWDHVELFDTGKMFWQEVRAYYDLYSVIFWQGLSEYCSDYTWDLNIFKYVDSHIFTAFNRRL